MYRKCTTEISALHQKQVIETLLELMQKMPYADITVTQLCQASGIPRRVFYHLFSNKTGALYALVDHTILNIAGYGNNVSDNLLRFFCYWKEQKALLDALSANAMAGLLQERLIESTLSEDRDLLYWLQRNGWPNNSREVIIFSLSGLMGLVYSWYYSGYQQKPEQMAALVEQIIRPHWK